VKTKFLSTSETYELKRIFKYFLFLRSSLTELLDGTFLFFAKKIRNYFTKLLEMLLRFILLLSFLFETILLLSFQIISYLGFSNYFVSRHTIVYRCIRKTKNQSDL
jgi:hypothetical protein